MTLRVGRASHKLLGGQVLGQRCGEPPRSCGQACAQPVENPCPHPVDNPV